MWAQLLQQYGPMLAQMMSQQGGPGGSPTMQSQNPMMPGVPGGFAGMLAPGMGMMGQQSKAPAPPPPPPMPRPQAMPPPQIGLPNLQRGTPGINPAAQMPSQMSEQEKRMIELLMQGGYKF